MPKLYLTNRGPCIETVNGFFLLEGHDWDDLINRDDLPQWIQSHAASVTLTNLDDHVLLPPIGRQEVWAAGVTYVRSREARMEESRQAGADDFYARVYDAPRPELFFKAAAHRVVGHLQPVRIRKDSHWNVPEPELALLINAAGVIIGCTVGNDVSSRDIEGENPLYLPQAKVYDQSCALGPGILLGIPPLDASTAIRMEIRRPENPSSTTAAPDAPSLPLLFAGETTLSQLKRTPEELVSYLYQETSFPHGCFLLTGTGIVPPDSFTLQPGDEIRITIDSVGVLVNTVAH